MRKRSVSVILGEQAQKPVSHSPQVLARKKAVLNQIEGVAHKRALLKKRHDREQHKKAQQKQYAHHEPKKFNWLKLFLWIAVLAAAFVLWQMFDIPALMLRLLQANPTVWSLYQTIQVEVEGRTLLGLLYASLLSTCVLTNPIFPLPPEVIFVYYLGLNYYVIQILTIMMIGSFVSMTINWLLGRLIGERVIKSIMKKSYPKFRQKLERAGGFIVLVGNIVPFPMEFFAVFLGAVKYGYKKFIIFTLIGRLIKFVLLALGFFYFMKYASPYLSTVNVDWFIKSITDIFVFW